MKRMKKILALALAAMLLLAAAGLADEVRGRIDFTEDIAPYEGRWVTFQDGFQLFMPTQWTRLETNEAQQQAGLFYRAGNGGADDVVGEVAMGIAVSFIKAGDLATLDDLAGNFESAGFAEIDKLDINGIPCITFIKADGDYRGVAFYHPKYPSYILAVYISPIGGDNALVNDVGSAILCSLSPFNAK